MLPVLALLIASYIKFDSDVTSNNIKKGLNLKDIGTICKHKLEPGSPTERARDFRMFMYLCNGINVKDLCLLKYDNTKRGGDYIDRGPAIRETLQIVKSMSDAGHAIARMGNHEYNALAYASLIPDGRYLREHNDKNYHQHQETLQAFEEYPGEWKDYLGWFGSLPLYFETDFLRAVHACWDDAHIKWLRNNGVAVMTEEFFSNIT